MFEKNGKLEYYTPHVEIITWSGLKHTPVESVFTHNYPLDTTGISQENNEDSL